MSESRQRTMKAVRWEGKPFSVSVRDVPIPTIRHSQDAIVRLTTSAICGTDLHAYHGRWDLEPETLGHENMGIVVEVGSDVTVIKKGDRVVVNADIEEPFDNGNSEDRGSFGVGTIGMLNQRNGGQAEYMRVPWASNNLIILPPGRKHELDYVLLADIWPTAWWALDRAGQRIGETVVVYGAGPVGLLCAYSAFLRGATRVYIVDRVAKRLEKGESIGCIPINFAECDPVKEILKHEPEGVDRSCECIGYECVDAKGKNIENLTIKWAIATTRPYGGIGLIGVHLPPGLDPKDPDGKAPFPYGDFFIKSLSIRGGVVDTRRFQDILLDLIHSKKASPSFVFDRKYDIEDAEEAYRDFSEHKIIKAYFRFEHHHRHYSSSPDRNGKHERHRRYSSSPERNGKRERHHSESPERNGKHERHHSKSPERNGKRLRHYSSSPERDGEKHELGWRAYRNVHQHGYGRGRPRYRS